MDKSIVKEVRASLGPLGANRKLWNHFGAIFGAIKVKCSEVFRKMLSSRALFCVALAVIACASVGEYSLHDVVVPHLAAAAGYVPGVYGASA